jgi:hypothetical protein
MEITTNSVNLMGLLIFVILALVVHICLFAIARKKSSDGFFETNPSIKLSLDLCKTMVLLFGFISLLWPFFGPVSFGMYIQQLAMFFLAVMITHPISLIIMWFFRGRTSPLMKLQKKKA